MLSEKRLTEILENSKNKKIAVIGDIMLDRYFWGNVSRISPEAPVPVIDLENETFNLGGASNVANNLNSLGLYPILIGVLGDDNSGKTFLDIANENSIDTNSIFIDSNRPTTVKTRIIGNNQQIARLDRESKAPIDNNTVDYFINRIKHIENLSGIILEDYNKGVVTNNLIEKVIAYAIEKQICVYVDPKYENFFNYKRVTLFKPNRKEASKALNMELNNKDQIYKAGNILLQKLECTNVLLTLGSEGMVLFESNGEVTTLPTRARHVADVSGAGDTAIATLSAANAGGADFKEAAIIANYASGIVCEEPGIVTITKSKLVKVIIHNNFE
jgi:rfaE bifunctional protein kinase chain/domain